MNTKFEPTWAIDLYIKDEQVAGATKVGLKVIKTEDGNRIRFRRRQTRRDKTLNEQPALVDENRNKVDYLIGNGSEVVVQFNVYTYGANRENTGVDLQGVQVLTLVPYGHEDGDEFEIKGDGGASTSLPGPAPAPAAEDTEAAGGTGSEPEFDDDELPGGIL